MRRNSAAANGRPTSARYTLCSPSPLARSGEYFAGSRPRSSPMWLLGWMRLTKHAKAHVYLPADRLPVAAGRAELRRLRALTAIGARDAECGDARVAEGEDDVARRDLADGLVEGVPALSAPVARIRPCAIWCI